MKKKASIGCLFWIAVILLVLVVFAFNKARIEHVLEITGFMDVISQDEPPAKIVASDPEKEKEAESSESSQTSEPARIDITQRDTEEESEPERVRTEKQAEEETEKSDEPKRSIRRSRLYFVDIESEKIKEVIRPVYYYDSPLTDTLNSLLAGPSAEELNMGLLSCIPGNTIIKGISVKNGVAHINVSEDFRFNQFGHFGYKSQLEQIVYTATEFPTVDAVQFYIEGKVHTYLGPEGVYIGGPLNRESFH